MFVFFISVIKLANASFMDFCFWGGLLLCHLARHTIKSNMNSEHSVEERLQRKVILIPKTLHWISLNSNGPTSNSMVRSHVDVTKYAYRHLAAIVWCWWPDHAKNYWQLSLSNEAQSHWQDINNTSNINQFDSHMHSRRDICCPINFCSTNSMAHQMLFVCAGNCNAHSSHTECLPSHMPFHTLPSRSKTMENVCVFVMRFAICK